MPLRDCLPKPASGPERSWIVPIRISSLLTPCCCAPARPEASARPLAAARGMSDLIFITAVSSRLEKQSGVHRLDALRVLGLDQLALELHRGCEFFVLGAELGFEQEEFLDLLDASELRVDAVHLGLDQVLHLLRARQALV